MQSNYSPDSSNVSSFNQLPESAAQPSHQFSSESISQDQRSIPEDIDRLIQNNPELRQKIKELMRKPMPSAIRKRKIQEVIEADGGNVIISNSQISNTSQQNDLAKLLAAPFKNKTKRKKPNQNSESLESLESTNDSKKNQSLKNKTLSQPIGQQKQGEDSRKKTTGPSSQTIRGTPTVYKSSRIVPIPEQSSSSSSSSRSSNYSYLAPPKPKAPQKTVPVPPKTTQKQVTIVSPDSGSQQSLNTNRSPPTNFAIRTRQQQPQQKTDGNAHTNMGAPRRINTPSTSNDPNDNIRRKNIGG
jgi:hypothetical protein